MGKGVGGKEKWLRGLVKEGICNLLNGNISMAGSLRDSKVPIYVSTLESRCVPGVPFACIT